MDVKEVFVGPLKLSTAFTNTFGSSRDSVEERFPFLCAFEYFVTGYGCLPIGEKKKPE